MKIFSFLTALLLFAGCNNTQKAPTESQTHDTAADTSVPEQPSPAAGVTVAATQEANRTEVSPAILYQKCAACHGNLGERSALNQSAPISDWDSKRIAAVIYGYQNGTYGGSMKTLMQNQVKGLTHDQVEALSQYIANLYVKTH
jgi:cytochrome c